MSDDRENMDRQALAAEHALDVLAGVERDEARKLEASDRTLPARSPDGADGSRRYSMRSKRFHPQASFGTGSKRPPD